MFWQMRTENVQKIRIHTHTRDKLNLKMKEEEEENHEALANAVVELRLFIQILCQPKKKNYLSLAYSLDQSSNVNEMPE